MAQNDFLAYATGGGANVVDQATYAAAGYVTAGRSSGILPSNVYNKINRQGNWIAHCIAQFMVDQTGQNVLDDGNYTNWFTTFVSAIAASITTQFSTGDAKLTLKAIADASWILMDDGTIGDASSGSTTRANADTSALFTVIWNNVSNTYATLFDSTGAPVARGASAAADFAAHRRLGLTKQLGRALIIAGAGNGLTSRQLGQTLGEETHLLVIGEIPAHSHGVNDSGHLHGFSPLPQVAAGPGFFGGGGGSGEAGGGLDSSTTTNGTGITIQNTGGGGSHNNMQPSTAWSIMLKLALPIGMFIPVIHGVLHAAQGLVV